MASKYKPQAESLKNNTRRVVLNLCLSTDKDILDWLKKQPAMQTAIKAAVREKIEKERERI